MAQAVIDAANRGTLMMWSADPATQALFDGTRLQGVLPATNEGATVLGVYFRDRSSSKIDYYLHTEATVTTNACTPDAPTYTVEVRLRFDIPNNVELPDYVDSNLYDFYRTEVFLYGPVGATTTAVEVPEPGLDDDDRALGHRPRSARREVHRRHGGRTDGTRARHVRRCARRRTGRPRSARRR